MVTENIQTLTTEGIGNFEGVGGCCTLSWWGGLRGLVTLEAISAGTAVPGRFNLAGQVPGERSDELQHLALQVGGWAKGQ